MNRHLGSMIFPTSGLVSLVFCIFGSGCVQRFKGSSSFPKNNSPFQFADQDPQRFDSKNADDLCSNSDNLEVDFCQKLLSEKSFSQREWAICTLKNKNQFDRQFCLWNSGVFHARSLDEMHGPRLVYGALEACTQQQERMHTLLLSKKQCKDMDDSACVAKRNEYRAASEKCFNSIKNCAFTDDETETVKNLPDHGGLKFYHRSFAEYCTAEKRVKSLNSDKFALIQIKNATRDALAKKYIRNIQTPGTSGNSDWLWLKDQSLSDSELADLVTNLVSNHVDFSHINVDGNTLRSLSFLKLVPQVKSLTAKNNLLDNIAALLPHKETLAYLRLENNPMIDFTEYANVSALIELEKFPNLWYLNLADAGISDRLLDEVNQFPSLRVLILDRNPQFTASNFVSVSLKSSGLTHLSLNQTGVTVKTLRQLTPDWLPRLSSLSLAETDLAASDFEDWAKTLKLQEGGRKFQSLKNLILFGDYQGVLDKAKSSFSKNYCPKAITGLSSLQDFICQKTNKYNDPFDI
jgi:hypothetical protein